MNVCYLGPFKDYSGYGEANRHAVAALDAAGVNVQAKLVTYATQSSDFGTLGTVIDRLLANQADYGIKILHTTPDEYARFMEPGKYHIGHFFWETDRIPKEFADGLELMDEIWTGSEANHQAILSSGVDKPVHIFPQAIETNRESAEKYELPGFPANGYLFYSIFEWTDRKNPEALLRAYYEEFKKGEAVGLLIKTYFRNFTLRNKREIKSAIMRLKSEMALEYYPPVYLYLDLMDRSQIWRLHETGDCFVSAHRGEGWGVPQVEAALTGNPLISTGYGGCHEYFKDGSNAHILPFKMIPLKGMEHSKHWYTADQQWAEVDPAALRQEMRRCYSDREKAVKMGVKASGMVNKKFNLKVVGQLMADRLKEIEEGLK